MEAALGAVALARGRRQHCRPASHTVLCGDFDLAYVPRRDIYHHTPTYRTQPRKKAIDTQVLSLSLCPIEPAGRPLLSSITHSSLSPFSPFFSAEAAACIAAERKKIPSFRSSLSTPRRFHRRSSERRKASTCCLVISWFCAAREIIWPAACRSASAIVCPSTKLALTVPQVLPRALTPTAPPILPCCHLPNETRRCLFSSLLFSFFLSREKY
jgi:hypothetical protein